MSCPSEITSYQRYKNRLLSQNTINARFKNNFIKLWEQYGEFKYINGKKCFSGYRVDCSGDGQIKMSKLLGQKNLYNEACDGDLDWVKLVFKFKIDVSDDDITAWIEDYKQKLENKEFKKIKFSLHKDGAKTWADGACFLDEDGNCIDDEFLNSLSGDIAKVALNKTTWYNLVPDEYGFGYTKVYYTQKDVEYETSKILVKSQIDNFRDELNDLSRRVLEWKIGTNLEQYVSISWYGDKATSNLYLSVDAAKEMKPKDFVELVTKYGDFDYQVHDSGWFSDFFGFVLAIFFIAIGMPEVGLSIFISTMTSQMDDKTLQAIGQAISFYISGPSGGFSSMSTTEAIELILNVASIYFTLRFKPPTEANHTEENDNTQKMFYQMPYDVYDTIYCYDELITIKT